MSITSGCPHFEITTNEEKTKVEGVYMSCGASNQIAIDETKEQKLHTTPFAKA